MARAQLSVVPFGATAGAVLGLALGGAYLAGGMAQSAADHARVSRLANVAAQGFSQDALEQAAGILALAQKFENTPAGASDTEVRPTVSSAANPYGFRNTALNQSRERECLTEAVYYEARGEAPSGQAAVAQVVMNRVRHPAFPKSICAVVFQGCQFSFACDGSMRGARDMAAWGRARKIADRVLEGRLSGPVGAATHFHVSNIQPGWSNLIRVAQVGTHVFYRFGPHRAAAQPLLQEAKLIKQLVEPTAPAAAGQVMLAAVANPEPLKVEAPAGAALEAAIKTEAPAKAKAETAIKVETPAAVRTAS